MELCEERVFEVHAFFEHRFRRVEARVTVNSARSYDAEGYRCYVPSCPQLPPSPIAIAWLIAIVTISLHGSATPVRAQAESSAVPSAQDHTPLEAWVRAGVDAAIGSRAHVMASGGWIGGFDSWVVLTEGSFGLNKSLQLLAGHVYLRPEHGDATDISVLRGGVNWSMLRGRLALDNRLLVERRSIRGGASLRVRDRLRLSWAIADASPIRLFTAFEAFAVDRHALSERRYQTGLIVPLERASIEAYCLRSTAPTRAPFNTLGLTLFWRIGPS